MFQNVRYIQDYYKPLHYLIISLVAYLNWVVLGSLWGTYFWLRTKITCHLAPSQPGLIIHQHLGFFLRNHHIQFRAMSILLSSSSHHPPFCSTEHHPDSETYLHKGNR